MEKTKFKPSKWQALRFMVFNRDGFSCQYCNKTSNELQIDHIKPIVEGGSDAIENLVTSCKDCNSGKWYIGLNEKFPTLAQILTRKGRRIKKLRKALDLLESLQSEEDAIKCRLKKILSEL